MTIELIGMDEIQKLLSDFVPKEANNLSRNLVFGLAQEAAKEAKQNVPTRTGNLKKSIKAKRRRGKPGQPASDVIATQGKSAKNDGFYWRFIENGTINQPERPFIRPAMDKIRASMPEYVDRVFTDKLRRRIKRIQKMNEIRA
jgi:HK97 gp10 family phage protein